MRGDEDLDVGLPAPYGTLGPDFGGRWADNAPPPELEPEPVPWTPPAPSFQGHMPPFLGMPFPGAAGVAPTAPGAYGPRGPAPGMRMRAAAAPPAPPPRVLDPIEKVTGFLNSWGHPPDFPGFRWNPQRRLYNVDHDAARVNDANRPLAHLAVQLEFAWTYLQPYRVADGEPWRYRWVETPFLWARAGDPPYVVRGELGGQLAPSTVTPRPMEVQTQPSGRGAEIPLFGGAFSMGASVPMTPYDLTSPPAMGDPSMGPSSGLSPWAEYRLENPPDPFGNEGYAKNEARRQAIRNATQMQGPI